MVLGRPSFILGMSCWADYGYWVRGSGSWAVWERLTVPALVQSIINIYCISFILRFIRFHFASAAARDTAARVRFYWTNENYLRWYRGAINLAPLFRVLAQTGLIRLSGWLCSIGNLALQNFVTSEKNDEAKFLAEKAMQCSIIERRIAYRTNWTSIIALSIRQEILHSHPFLLSRKFKTQFCTKFQTWSQNGLNWFSQIRGIV